jgi:molybdate transport repressor ModE-like protein
MQLSYSSCWNIIRTLESQLNYSLIERSQGGAGGSTSDLTQKGRDLLDRYNAYEKQLKDQANKLYETYFGGLFE